MAIFVLLTIWLTSTLQGLISAFFAASVIIAFGVLQNQGALHYSYVRPPEDAALLILILLIIGVLFGFTVSADLRDELRQRRKSEARFQLLFMSNPLASLLSSDKGIVDVNLAWEAMFGLTRAEVIGRSSVELNLWVDPEHLSSLRERIDQGRELSSAPVKLRRKNGDVGEFLLSSTRIELDGAPHTVVSLLDQTERLAAEAALQTLNLELESRIDARTQELSTALDQLRLAHKDLIQSEKLASLGALVAGISHELNTPIGNAVTVASTLVDKATELDARCQSGHIRKSELSSGLGGIAAMASLIDRSAQRAATLIASFKQVAIDQTSERRRDFDLREVVEDLLTSVRPGLNHLPWQIDNNIPAGIACDSFPGPLGQVVTNLIQNAVLHAFPNRSAGTITLDAKTSDDRLVLTVRDDGVGMDSVTLVRIFDPFFTTKLGKGGSGLGLSICHRIATTILAGEMPGMVFTSMMLKVSPTRM